VPWPENSANRIHENSSARSQARWLMHIRVDDTVEVISGDDQGTRGTGAHRRSCDGPKWSWKESIEFKKHVHRSQRNPQRGRLSKEMPVQLSNVRLVCSACDAATRTGARHLEDGSKVRYCKQCSANIGQIPRPRRRPPRSRRSENDSRLLARYNEEILPDSRKRSAGRTGCRFRVSRRS